MRRVDTMSIKELRELIEDMPDDGVVMCSSPSMDNHALSVHLYPVETTLDSQDVLLLELGYSDSVRFSDC